jgi:hypothetical protein
MSAFFDNNTIDQIGVALRETKGEELTIAEMDKNFSTILDAVHLISKGQDPLQVPAFQNAISPIIAGGELFTNGDITYNVDFINGYAVIDLSEVNDDFSFTASAYVDVKNSSLGVSIGGGSTGLGLVTNMANNHGAYSYIVLGAFDGVLSGTIAVTFSPAMEG